MSSREATSSCCGGSRELGLRQETTEQTPTCLRRPCEWLSTLPLPLPSEETTKGKEMSMEAGPGLGQDRMGTVVTNIKQALPVPQQPHITWRLEGRIHLGC